MSHALHEVGLKYQLTVANVEGTCGDSQHSPSSHKNRDVQEFSLGHYGNHVVWQPNLWPFAIMVPRKPGSTRFHHRNYRIGPFPHLTSERYSFGPASNGAADPGGFNAVV